MMAPVTASDVRHTHGDAASLADDGEDMIVEQMLAIVVSQSDGSDEHAAITRDDVVRIYREVQGDPSRVYDDVMTLLAIRAMRAEEQAANGGGASDAKLQWRELCHGLGLSECHEVFRILEELPEEERDAALSDNGGFFQNLLWKLEEEQRAADELEKTMALVQLLDEQDAAAKGDEEHPLERLRRLFPDYKMHVIEDVYEAQGFDLDAAAAALANINAVSQVKSFASVLKASRPTTMWKKGPTPNTSGASAWGGQGSGASTPAVESLGQFPVLPAKSKRGRHGKMTRHHNALSTVTPSASQFAAQRKNAELVNKRLEGPNAWNTQADGAPALEAKLTTDLKLERLQRLLPSIDRELIRTTFFLNNGSSTATEAALREIFNLPMPEQAPLTSQQAVEDDDLSPVTTADASVEDNPTYAECRARVDNCWHQLSDRYVAALRSFNRDHHIIANERVRDITAGRRALRDAQHAAAHAFVEAHLTHIRRHQALDLHGLTVVESLRVAREVIDVCRAERIRRCILICGVGNHSINQKARLLTAIQLSLEHRGIAFRKESGALYIYPLRSSS